ncbi:MAG: hypothetical protein [Cotesia congregata filamentous virus 2]
MENISYLYKSLDKFKCLILQPVSNDILCFDMTIMTSDFDVIILKKKELEEILEAYYIDINFAELTLSEILKNQNKKIYKKYSYLQKKD